MSQGPKVAIVVLGWNGKKFLQQFMPSWVATTYSNAELIIADNASTDDSLEFIRSNYPEVRIIETGGNYGFAKGYNVALKQIEADYYVLLNQDVEVTPGWIEPLVNLLEQHPEAGAAQPKIRAFHYKDSFEYAGAAGGYMDKWGYMFCRGRVFDTVEQDEGQYDTVESIFWASGAALFIRAELYHQLGGLDADFFAHMEEIDLCWRMKNAGYDILYTSDSLVYHVGGGSLPQGNPRKTFLNFRNNLAMMAKNIQGAKMIPTIVIRMFMDDAAALKSMLDGKPKDTWAIVKSHFAFYAWIPSLLKKRSVNKKLWKQARPSGVYQGSIVAEYFLKGKKLFSELDKALFSK